MALTIICLMLIVAIPIIVLGGRKEPFYQRYRIAIWTTFAASVIGFLTFPAFLRTTDPVPPTCEKNMRAILTALAIYSNDYGGRFPPVSSSAQLDKFLFDDYVSSMRTFQCPDRQDQSDLSRNDYQFNTSLSGALQKEVAARKEIPWILKCKCHGRARYIFYDSIILCGGLRGDFQGRSTRTYDLWEPDE
ncbi:MAG TPA: hypothetical protein PL033_17735 [Candidatus Brocadiia bacterium]|nr:hypothetical protein [Candidatus Brocadiia bacterium]